MKLKLFALTAVTLGALTACGGGGGSATANSTPTGTINLAVMDGPGDDYDHVWVTITKIAFHTDPNATWSAADATWQSYTLPSPVTLDLAALNNGALNTVFAGLSLPIGTYKQIRMFLAGHDATLTSSAQAVLDNETTPTPLQWNDQVEYSDATGVHESPLEIAYPVQGMQLNGTFNVSAGSTLNLAVDFDLEHDVVKFLHGGVYNFTMKPNLRYFDLSQSGAVTGQIATTNLCTAHYSGVTNNSACAYNLIVKAEVLSADGSRHYDTRATNVKADGSFSLFPLPAGASYDILIRGRNLQTSLIKGVSVSTGSTVASGATQLSTVASPITPVVANNNEYFANFASALAPTSGWAVFQQTLPSGVPYEVRWGNTNPYTGLLQNPMALQLGPISVANYSAGTPLSFSNVSPVEGDGAYSVGSNGLAYYTLGANAPLAAATPGTQTTFSPSDPTLASGIATGSVSGTIANNTPAGTYDKAYLVFSRFSNIMETVDVSAQVAAGSGPFTVSLPAGTSTTAVPGAYYYAYLRVWNSAHPKATLKVVPFNGFADLRHNTLVTGFNVSF